MTTSRTEHTATLLPDGKVLVAGGTVGACLSTSTAELYDPDAGTWSATGNMQSSRGGHVATLIPSGPMSGMVLAAGGYINQNDGGCGGDAQLASAELYRPRNRHLVCDKRYDEGERLPRSRGIARRICARSR